MEGGRELGKETEKATETERKVAATGGEGGCDVDG